MISPNLLNVQNSKHYWVYPGLKKEKSLDADIELEKASQNGCFHGVCELKSSLALNHRDLVKTAD